MSPYPAQIDYTRLIETARQMIESDGLEALSLSKLANAFGVKAPSLYKHVASKNALLKAVNLLTIQELINTLSQQATLATQPIEKLVNVALAYRIYAHNHPMAYALAFSTTLSESRPDEDLLVAMVLPLQAMMAEIAGEANALTALRGIFALIHGYVLLEINQQLRRGGDLAATYEQVVRAYLHGWAA